MAATLIDPEDMTAPESSTPQRGQAARTRVARQELSFGSLDTLSAERFAARYPAHFHETFAIGVVESGATRLRTARGEFTASAGSLLAFSPGEVHAAEPATPDGYTYRMIYPSVELMRAVGIDTSLLSHGLPLFDCPVIEDPDLGRMMRAALASVSRAESRLTEADLAETLRTVADRHGARREAFVSIRLADRDVVDRARQYLHAHFAEPLRLSALARECGLSVCHLIRVFQRVVGVPPYAYLVQLRVIQAQARLRRGERVSDVAYHCGFSDQSHLTRLFKRVIGVPPGQYVRETSHAAV